MPHRRSSDVADGVWLISEETIYPGNHLSINSDLDKTLSFGSPHCYCGPGWDYLPNPNPQEGVTSQCIHGKIRRSPECLHRLPRCGQDLVWTEQDHGGKL